MLAFALYCSWCPPPWNISPLTYHEPNFVMAQSDTFCDQLALVHPGFGHVLWEPQLGLAVELPPVEIGDVSLVCAGKLLCLFNAPLPGDHPSMKDSAYLRIMNHFSSASKII